MPAVHFIQPNAIIRILVDQLPRIASIREDDRPVDTVTGWTAVAAHLNDQRVGLPWYILELPLATAERKREGDVNLRIEIAPAMTLLTSVVTSGRAGAILVLLVGDSTGVGHENEGSGQRPANRRKEKKVSWWWSVAI